MHVILALLFLAICGASIVYALLRPGPVAIFMATVSLFSVGHYGLPMLLVERSELRYLPDKEISSVIAMALMYFVAIIIGASLLLRRESSINGIKFPILDRILEDHWWKGALVSSSVTIAYYSIHTFTWYQVENVEVFIETRSPFEGLLGFFVTFAQAAMSLYGAIAFKNRWWRRFYFILGAVAIELFLLRDAGQRLVFITPILVIFAVLVAQREFKTAGMALLAGVGALVIISPFAVALRSGSWNNQQDVIAESFSYGDDPVDTMLQSIVDRGDILVNMTYLKAHVDSQGYVGPMYYYSIFVIPIPRFLYKDKPSILSDNGRKDGEASVLAWRLKLNNNMGSLTAFGSIVAYREGGWVWMIINGLLSGALFAWVFTACSRGGFIAQTCFGVAFVAWSISKVPTSLFESMVTVMTYLPVILALFIIERVLQGERFGLQRGSDPALADAPVPADAQVQAG